MRRELGLIRAVPVGALLLLLAGIAPAAAQDDADVEPRGGPLAIGPWAATANASGVSDGTEMGVQFEWVGEIPAQFEFDVSDGGGVNGTWSHQGSAVLTLDGSVQGNTIQANAPMTMSGSGAVSGNSSRLTLNGTSRTIATMTSTVAGHTATIPVDNTHPLPTLQVSVRSTRCDEAYGDWVYTIEDAFTDQGLSSSFDGHWIGYRESDEVHDHVDDLLDRAAMGGDEVPDFTSMTPFLASAAELLWRYNDFVDDFPNWAVSDVLDAMEWADDLINGLRNLSDCDERLFGEDLVEEFTNGLTLVVQELVLNILAVENVSSSAWQQLSQIAARTGAIGPGAEYPDRAAAAEAALIEAGSTMLTDNLDGEGYINVTDDTKRVMSTGAAMGWEFDVNGETYDARQTFDDYLEAGGTE